MPDNFSFFLNGFGGKKINKTKFKGAVSVSIDTYNSVFHIARMDGTSASTATHEEKPYKSKPYTEAFYKELTQFLTEQVQAHGNTAETAFTMIVNDFLIATDTISVPNINRRKNNETLNVMAGSLYKNYSDLKLDSALTALTKQVATYSVSMINRNVLSAVVNACSDAGMTPDYVTFDSNANMLGVSAANPKLKNMSYVLLDVKHNASRVIFVIKGRTAGFYQLPFGYSVLTKNKVLAENMLFEHSAAELAVVNAREKAKAKQLTVAQNNENDENAENDEEAMFGAAEDEVDDPTANTQPAAPETIKTLPKKTPRVLPKFMQRPTPKDENEFGTENFRVFTKWVLNLIQSNERLTARVPLEGVYVNMPDEFDYIFETVNAEKEENKITFNRVQSDFGKPFAMQNIELMGGLFTSTSETTNLF